MSIRTLYLILSAIIVLGVLGAWYSYIYLSPLKVKEDFESGFINWVADADVPLDPNNPSHSVEWNISHVTGAAKSGQYSVRLFIDGSQDDGTIWIERKIGAKRDWQVQVKVSFQFYSEQESFNTIAAVVAYAGVRSPESEEDFTVVGSANEVAGWKEYSHETIVDTGSSEELWVAVGISVRWETQMAYFIDDVQIEIR